MAVGTYAALSAVKTRLGITGTSDALLQAVCDQVNDWLEAVMGRVVAPRPESTVTLDGWLAEPDEWGVPRRLPCPFGIRSLSQLEVAYRTGGSYVVVPTADWFLRPHIHMRRPGWPATMVILSDVPTGSIGRFYGGRDTVRLTGTFGWEVVPDDLAEVAEVLAVRSWHARQSGQADIVGTDETGAPIVSRLLNARDRETIARYAIRPRAAGGDALVTAW